MRHTPPSSKQSLPNKDQIYALVSWARLYGRTWRAKLRAAWMSGNYNNFSDAHLLQQVRNTVGPEWLDKDSKWITQAANVKPLKGDQ